MSILRPMKRRRSSSLPTFNALEISGCLWWLKPEASTMLDDADNPLDADGDLIGTWYDQSGNANHFIYVTSTTRCPLYKVNIQNGLAMAKFDGSNDHMSCNALSAYFDGEDAAMTVAAVIKKATNTSGDTVFAASSSTTTTPVWQPYTATNYGISKRDDAATLSNPTGGSTDTNAHVLVYRFNGTTVDLWVDSTQIFTGIAHNVGVLTLDRFALGAWISTTTTQYHDGYVGDFVGYNGALSDANVALLRTGLLTKWGL